MKKIMQILLAVSNIVDIRDAFVFGGTGLVGYGIGQIYSPASYIVIGAVIFWLGVRRVSN